MVLSETRSRTRPSTHFDPGGLPMAMPRRGPTNGGSSPALPLETTTSAQHPHQWLQSRKFATAQPLSSRHYPALHPAPSAPNSATPPDLSPASDIAPWPQTSAAPSSPFASARTVGPRAPPRPRPNRVTSDSSDVIRASQGAPCSRTTVSSSPNPAQNPKLTKGGPKPGGNRPGSSDPI